MPERYVIGIDQSTQGTKAILVDERGEVAGRSYLPHAQLVSEEGWVSHDGEEILRNVAAAARELLERTGVSGDEIAAVGLSNQRETTIGWDRETGESVGPAIVWQCARAKEITDGIRDEAFRASVREKTGIPLSPYFPAAKAAWLLRHNALARELAGKGRLCLGTMDSFLVFRLTEGKVFRTDYSNASRTQLFNLHSLSWDSDICGKLGIPAEALAKVTDSDGDYGVTTLGGVLEKPVPIRGVLGDSHGALFGQGCLRPGMAKATYGTGSSIMMNIGPEFKESRSGLVTSLAWGRGGKVDYVLEGNINYSGAVITWLKEIGLVTSPGETAAMAKAANPEDTTYLVPAFSGLGAPYWSDSARASFCGMSRTTGRNELVKAGLEAIAYQVTDIVEAMGADSGLPLEELRVDGGPTANDYLMQFQSDMARAQLRVPKAEELSAIGAALMAGISAGAFDEKILVADRMKTAYAPKLSAETRSKKLDGWRKAVQTVMEE